MPGSTNLRDVVFINDIVVLLLLIGLKFYIVRLRHISSPFFEKRRHRFRVRIEERTHQTGGEGGVGLSEV